MIEKWEMNHQNEMVDQDQQQESRIREMTKNLIFDIENGLNRRGRNGTYRPQVRKITIKVQNTDFFNGSWTSTGGGGGRGQLNGLFFPRAQSVVFPGQHFELSLAPLPNCVHFHHSSSLFPSPPFPSSHFHPFPPNFTQFLSFFFLKMNPDLSTLGQVPFVLTFPSVLCHLFGVCLRPGRSPAISDGSMRNVTTMRGDTAEFRCRVENPAKHKVAFFRDELPPKLIAYDESVFRRTDKYELLARVNGDEWILRIRNVQEEDAGGYICQLNSSPVLSRKGHLELRIPPSISRSSTPAAVEVREGHNVTLSCRARGNPAPTIVWRRADRQIIRYNGVDGYGDSVHKGADLELSRVSRKHMSEYVCVASNGIAPDESWTIKLHVLFEPIVVPQSMVVEAPVDAPIVRIACTVEAWPRPNVLWMFEGQSLHDSAKYSTEQSVFDRYKSVHVLEIRHVQRDQFGQYRCMASNDYGTHFGEIRLIEAPPADDHHLPILLNEGSGALPDDEEGDAEDGGAEGAATEGAGEQSPQGLDGWHWPRTTQSPSLWLQKQRQMAAADKELRRSVSHSRGFSSSSDFPELSSFSSSPTHGALRPSFIIFLSYVLPPLLIILIPSLCWPTTLFPIFTIR